MFSAGSVLESACVGAAGTTASGLESLYLSSSPLISFLSHLKEGRREQGFLLKRGLSLL
jgi:hypothetical protein